MSFRRISPEDLRGKGNTGRPDTPGVSTAEMQRIMDEVPKEVIVPAVNELADQLERDTAAADLGTQLPGEAGDLPEETPHKLQAVLGALLAKGKVHANRRDNPHGVTAAQVNAYTKDETDDAITKKIEKVNGSVLIPVPTPEDAGKVPVAQANGSYTLQKVQESGETGLSTATDVIAKVPTGLPPETSTNVQAVLDAEKVLTDGYVIGSKEKAAEFAALFANTGTVESFLFFTDPHLQRVTSPKVTGEMLAKIRDVYRSTPTSFVLCGGDWLNSGDTTESACYLLGSYDAYMRKNCAPYVPVVGNHDTNYQNRAFEETAPNYNRAVGLANALPQKVVNNLLFREEGKAYYAFRAPQSTVYVLDTGIDWVPDMDEYRWEQIDWLATKMITDAAEHSFIACHIAYNNANVPPMTHNIAAVINAFNNRSTLSLNGHTYDFSGMSGTCHFILAGHNHADYCGDVDGVPTILTTNVMDTTYPENKWPAFDLCLADYDAAVLHLVRVGNGINRDIPIIPDLGLGLPVTYGLVFHLDGKNRGTVPGEWKELVSGSPVTLKYCEEKADCVGFSGSAGGRFNAFGDFGTNTLTIECVFKPDTAAANMSAVLFNTRSTQTLYSNNVGVYNGQYISDSRKQNPTYVTHFNAGELITVSISKARAIENGEVLIEGTPEVYGGTDGSQTLISIGAQGGPSSKYHFHGDIYAIRVYNRVLTEAEIQRNQQYDRKTYFGSGTSELH